MDFTGLSSAELRDIAEHAAKLADYLEDNEPSYELAKANGIRDCGYDTYHCGFVHSYSGMVTIKMDDGSIWQAIGHRPKGGAGYVSKQGFIEVIKL